MKGGLLMARHPWVLPQSYTMEKYYSSEDLRFGYISKKGICVVWFLLKWNKVQTLESDQFDLEILLSHLLKTWAMLRKSISLVLNFLIYEVKMMTPSESGYKCGMLSFIWSIRFTGSQ